jgi:rhamnose transport system substrate-binding protein
MFRTSHRALLATTLVVSLATLLCSACNRESTSSGTSTGGSPTGAKKLRVVYIPKNTGNPYFTEVGKGCEEAAKELGTDYTTTAPATGDATSQIPIITEQIQRGVDVMLISPNSPDALNLILDQARQHGTTVITVDADLVGNEKHRDAAVLQTDFSKIGPAQVELLGKLIGYEGDIAILSATTDAPNQKVWVAGMNEALKQPKYAKMHLVATVFGNDDQQKSTTECESLLTRFPNLRGIISPTSVGLAAAAQVVERTGVYPGGPHAAGKGLQLTGLSTPNQLKKFVGKGVVTAFQLWEPSNMGYLGVHLGEQIHSQKLFPTPGSVLKTPKFGKSTLGENGVLIAGPLVTFDISNIDKYDF